MGFWIKVERMSNAQWFVVFFVVPFLATLLIISVTIAILLWVRA